VFRVAEVYSGILCLRFWFPACIVTFTVIVSCDIFIETNFDDRIYNDVVFLQGDSRGIVCMLCGDIIGHCAIKKNYGTCV
jgi:hypothetical protein